MILSSMCAHRVCQKIVGQLKEKMFKDNLVYVKVGERCFCATPCASVAFAKESLPSLASSSDKCRKRER